jgi:hypothetical protein
VCGQKSIPSTALIVKGDTTNKGEFPWQVAIYQRRGNPETKQLICGGTLISERIILTGDFLRICRYQVNNCYIFSCTLCHRL